jgi:hypothetical protein
MPKGKHNSSRAVTNEKCIKCKHFNGGNYCYWYRKPVSSTTNCNYHA